MNVEIQSIADKGNYEKERIVLKVLADGDIGDYLVLQTGFENGEVTIATYYTYWFPYKAVFTGDLVVLYTKIGKDSEKVLKHGRNVHFYYWGQKSSVWNRVGRAPVVLFAPQWTYKDPDEL